MIERSHRVKKGYFLSKILFKQVHTNRPLFSKIRARFLCIQKRAWKTYHPTLRPAPPPYPLLLVCLIRLSIRHNYLIVLHQIILAVFDLTNNWPYSIVGLKTVIKNSITFPDFHCNNVTVLFSTGWTRVGYKLATALQGTFLVTLLATVGYN